MIELKHSNILSSVIGKNGLSAPELKKYARKLRDARVNVLQQAESGSLGFVGLPDGDETAQELISAAGKWRGKFENFIVLGIGGSALGNIALQSALRHTHWNLLSNKERGGWLRLFVADNVDPAMISDLLDAVDLKKSVINVVSKSGTTAECLASYFIVKEKLERKVGAKNVAKHLVFTTDPSRGYLRDVANKEGVQTFSVPGNVGGRFSVLTPVGLLSAAATGIPVDEILKGARAVRTRCLDDNMFRNPASLFALVHHLYYKKGRPIHVLMPYSHPLRDMADWFRQLWAESLGKKKDRAGHTILVGPTPVKALGVTDQHSQVQLYIEGPQDKVVTFISVGKPDHDVRIPSVKGHYLSGQSLFKLFKSEESATRAALSKEGRPNLTLSIPSVSPESVGEMIYMFEMATAYSGELFDINAYDQPGVEQGKVLTYALMGREGFASHLQSFRKFLR